jgi:DNA polymerase-3 subunit delta'
VRAIEPEPGRRGVSIDQIRLVEHAAGLRPYEGEWKVFILRGADTMPEPAANALLKTLEEPPEDTVLVLTAADGSQVLPTIASRCREVPLRPVPAAEIAGALRMRGADPETAERLGRLAGGRPGWALSALAHPALAEALGETLDQLEALLAQPHVTRLTAAGSMGDAAAADAALDLWLTWWRDALLVQQGCPELVVHRERLESLRRLGAPPAVIWRALSRIQETRQQLAANVNVRLAVEALLLDLPDPASPS